jgi:hypothetical protein
MRVSEAEINAIQPQIEQRATNRRCAAGGVRPLGDAGHASPGGEPEFTAARRERSERRAHLACRSIGEGLRGRASRAQAADQHPCFAGHLRQHHRQPPTLRAERASDNGVAITRSAYFPHVRAARGATPRATVESLPRVSAPREHTFEGSRPSAARTDGSSPHPISSTDPSGFATQRSTATNALAVGTPRCIGHVARWLTSSTSRARASLCRLEGASPQAGRRPRHDLERRLRRGARAHFRGISSREGPKHTVSRGF